MCAGWGTRAITRSDGSASVRPPDHHDAVPHVGRDQLEPRVAVVVEQPHVRDRGRGRRLFLRHGAAAAELQGAVRRRPRPRSVQPLGCGRGVVIGDGLPLGRQRHRRPRVHRPARRFGLALRDQVHPRDLVEPHAAWQHVRGRQLVTRGAQCARGRSLPARPRQWHRAMPGREQGRRAAARRSPCRSQGVWRKATEPGPHPLQTR